MRSAVLDAGADLAPHFNVCGAVPSSLSKTKEDTPARKPNEIRCSNSLIAVE